MSLLANSHPIWQATERKLERLDIKISAKTVGELRKITAWPDNLAITTLGS